MHVTGTEVILINTILGHEVQTLFTGQTSCHGFFGCSKHAFGLVTVEQVSGLAHLSTDGSTVYLAVNILTVIGQFLDFVLVVTNADTYLPLPILQVEHLGIHGYVEAVVLQLTTV